MIEGRGVALAAFAIAGGIVPFPFAPATILGESAPRPDVGFPPALTDAGRAGPAGAMAGAPLRASVPGMHPGGGAVASRREPWEGSVMLWSFRLFLLLYIPFVLAAADNRLFDGALARAMGGVIAPF